MPTRSFLLASVAVLLLPPGAVAGTITVSIATPMIPVGASGKVELFWGIDLGAGMLSTKNPLATATLTSVDTAATKTAALMTSMSAALKAKYTITSPTATTIHFGAPPATRDGIVLKSTAAGERDTNFRLAKDDATYAYIGWTGPFDPFDANGSPAEFVASIVADAGMVSATFLASEFVSLSDGSFIASKFYSALAPQVSSLGVVLALNGAGLDIFYPDGTARELAGIDFGTTSSLGAVEGGMMGTVSEVPEPATLSLIGTGIGMLLARHRRRH
jgi:PEP-CTERM motif